MLGHSSPSIESEILVWFSGFLVLFSGFVVRFEIVYDALFLIIDRKRYSLQKQELICETITFCDISI